MAMAMTLRLRPASSCTQPPSHLFSFFSSSSSSSSSNDGENEENPSPSPSPPPSSSSSSYFKDVKASLRQSPIPNRRIFSPSQPQTPPPSPKPSKIASLEEIRKNLSEFRRKSAAPPSHPHPPSISFQELYKSNVIDKTTTTTDPKSSRSLSFEAIRENLRQLRSTSSTMKQQRSKGFETLNPLSLQVLKESLKLKPPPPAPETGTSVLGPSIFRREAEMDSQPSIKTEFVRMYSYGELGEKLKKLRPPAEVTAGKKDWFSLGELNERLRKLREMEEKEAESRIGGVSFKDLRESLVKLQKSSDVSAKKSSGNFFFIFLF